MSRQMMAGSILSRIAATFASEIHVVKKVTYIRRVTRSLRSHS